MHRHREYVEEVNTGSIVIGRYASTPNQRDYAVAIGSTYGGSQREYAVAVGYHASYTNQGSNSIPFGGYSANSCQYRSLPRNTPINVSSNNIEGNMSDFRREPINGNM